LVFDSIKLTRYNPVTTSTSGWRDLKTMEFYIRVAGVDEKGATDCLSILPSEAEVMENVVNLFNFK